MKNDNDKPSKEDWSQVNRKLNRQSVYENSAKKNIFSLQTEQESFCVRLNEQISNLYSKRTGPISNKDILNHHNQIVFLFFFFVSLKII